MSTSEKSSELNTYVSNHPELGSFHEAGVSYNDVLKDKFFVVNAVKKGITNSLFSEIKSNSPFDEDQWCHFLDINIRTLQRYKKAKNHIYKPLQSERIFELAEVTSLGHEVFDSPEDFSLWLNTPSPALANLKPVELLDTSYGKDLIISELNRIEHGIFI